VSGVFRAFQRYVEHGSAGLAEAREVEKNRDREWTSERPLWAKRAACRQRTDAGAARSSVIERVRVRRRGVVIEQLYSCVRQLGSCVGLAWCRYALPTEPPSLCTARQAINPTDSNVGRHARTPAFCDLPDTTLQSAARPSLTDAAFLLLLRSIALKC